MTKIWSYMPFALACLVAEGALVVGLAYGIGSYTYSESSHVQPIPACIDGIDGHCP